MSKKLRKHKLILYFILIVCISLLCSAYLYDNKSTFSFSHEPGFYSSDFYLKIFKPTNAEVFYTLDGSIPSEQSLKYTEPIHIMDATRNPNVYSAISEDNLFTNKTVYGWEDQYICKPAVPTDNVDKCTVIRAICKYEDGTFSDEIVSSYFVGFDQKAGYENMMIASLISDPDGLFGYENGINVRGATFDTNDFENTEWALLKANYRERGRDWERETIFQFFDANRNHVLSQKCGMRVHGVLSRHYNVKSYNLYARKEYDGNNQFGYDFWNTGYYPDKLVLYGCGQDNRSMVRDKMVSELTEDLSLTRLHYVPCVIFLDGEYWGIRYICEKIDEEYFNYYYGIDKRDILEIKYKQDNPLELGEISLDSDRFSDYATCLMGKYNESMSMDLFNKTFDRNSITDYFATMIYISRQMDWPVTNIAYWASNSKGEGYADGKWRAILYDVYIASTSESLIDSDSIEYATERYPMLEYLLKDESFNNEFFDRMNYIDTVCFENDKVDAYLDNYVKEMSAPMEKHMKRFYGDNITIDTFNKEIESIRAFFHGRGEYLNSTRK